MSKSDEEIKYYSLDRILQEDVLYYVIFGERSTGKTYAVKERIVERALKYGEDGAILRRFEIDFKGKRGNILFADIVANGLVEKYSNGEYTDIYYYSGMWYFCSYTEKGVRIKAPTPFCYAFTLASGEHDKSTSYPKVKTILFDEFITRQMYLPNEFVLFQQQISTIVRQRDDVKIFMCGNSVNKYGCIYFKEMGLRHIDEMEQGTIAVYEQGNGLKIAVEYTGHITKSGNKKSDKYFAFDNPQLQMITTGKWEMAMYPHLPYKYKTTDIDFIYFIEYEGKIMQCEVVNLDDGVIFTYVHIKTTPLKEEEGDYIYSTEFNAKPNWKRKITLVTNELERRIYWFYKNEKVFYQDNDVGELMRSYIQWCRVDKGVLN